MQWRGLINTPPKKHSIYFLNACDVGQTEQVANFLLRLGTNGFGNGRQAFIGGMWPLSDKGAS
jgi:hypothetical protein